MTEFFDAHFRETKLADRERQTDSDIALITRLSPPTEFKRLLDVGCGVGRIAIPLSRRGYCVLGVDVNLNYIQEAASIAKTQGSGAEFTHDDDRTMNLSQSFDVAISMFTSFGYHDDGDNRRVLANLFSHLRPGGILILEVLNRDQYTTSNVKLDDEAGLTVIKEYSFEFMTSRMLMSWTYLKNDQVIARRKIMIRLYSAHELLNLLIDVGFVEVELTSKVAGVAPELSKNYIFVATKPI